MGTPVYSMSINGTTSWGDFPGVGEDALKLWNIGDIAVDSIGAVYVVANSTDPSQSGLHRIYKFAPVTVATDGMMTPGGLLGWMGLEVLLDSNTNLRHFLEKNVPGHEITPKPYYGCAQDFLHFRVTPRVLQ